MNPNTPIDIIAYTIPKYPKVCFRANTVTTCETIPNPGKIKIYTSGCPKNQNKCWYNTGSPPPAGSKNEVLKFRSVNNIVIAPAKTGNDNNNKTAVILTAQQNNGNRCMVLPGARMFIMVVIKFTAPKIDETPAKCNEKIAKSTDGPLCASTEANGGYTVHPVPAPASTKDDETNLNKAGGNNQNEMLFNRGNAISGAPNILGTNQFPNPPIKNGITKKKIIINACAVTITLYNWWFPDNACTPGAANSNRIHTDKVVPTTPDNVPKIIYKVPISLWFVENLHRDAHVYKPWFPAL